MKIYVFGNQDVEQDSFAIAVAKEVQSRINSGELGDLADIDFEFVRPNQDLPFEDGKDIVIMDVVKGISEVRIFEDADLDKLISPPRSSVHEFDLGFQLKYLKKLGKLGKVTIVALPVSNEVNYMRVTEVFAELSN